MVYQTPTYDDLKFTLDCQNMMVEGIFLYFNTLTILKGIIAFLNIISYELQKQYIVIIIKA